MPRRATSTINTAAALIPERPTLVTLRTAAVGCRACDLWRTGTQTVFGDGEDRAEAMFIEEQPGDQEDLAGRPFVGPAGQVLDRALGETGIDRRKTYIPPFGHFAHPGRCRP